MSLKLLILVHEVQLKMYVQMINRKMVMSIPLCKLIPSLGGPNTITRATVTLFSPPPFTYHRSYQNGLLVPPKSPQLNPPPNWKCQSYHKHHGKSASPPSLDNHYLSAIQISYNPSESAKLNYESKPNTLVSKHVRVLCANTPIIVTK